MSTCVTRARVMPSRRAMAAWVATAPESSSCLQASALRSVSTTGGIRGSRGGSGGLARRWRSGTAVTTWLVGTRRVRLPRPPVSKAQSGPRVTSTFCSRYAAEPFDSSRVTWTIRNQTSGVARLARRLVEGRLWGGKTADLKIFSFVSDDGSRGEASQSCQVQTWSIFKGDFLCMMNDVPSCT